MRCRVHRGCNKKLRCALRYDLTRKGTDEFLVDLIEEEPDAAALFAGREEDLERPDDARWPAWAGHLYAAWSELRDDRHYGDMGGLSRIHFVAINGYAARYGIAGAAFDNFLMFIRAIDDEYVDWSRERAKEEAEKAKRRGAG